MDNVHHSPGVLASGHSSGAIHHHDGCPSTSRNPRRSYRRGVRPSMESRWRAPGQWQKRQCGMAVVETLADFKRYAEVDETKSHCSYRVAHIFVSTGTFVTHPRTLDGLLPVHLQPLLTSGGGTSGAIIWLIRIANRNGGAGAGPVSRRRFLRSRMHVMPVCSALLARTNGEVLP